MSEKPIVRTNLTKVTGTKQGYFLAIEYMDREPSVKECHKYFVGLLAGTFGKTSARYNIRYTDNGMVVRFNDKKDITWLMFRI